ncbi:MAG: winged helix-turn-helix domain-containing protein, partial [Synergistaceae bacterium]|nr:winged helix-turn-helix domain-containing protein [Synergistaceae bacterium]
GAADTLFSLKRARVDKGGILHRTGRDVEEMDFAMQLDGFGWTLVGEAEEFTIPEWKRQILNYLKEHNSVTPMELSQAIDISLSAAQQNLRRLAKEGTIQKKGYGTYLLSE